MIPCGVLFLHETHEVVGSREEAFEAAVRDEWRPALARDGAARLLYYLHHAHGTGVSYNVVTVTALRDAAAWQTLHDRVHGGDLTSLATRLDDLRHDVHAKLLVPLPWSPLQELPLDDAPVDAGEHAASLFMEDTVWPFEGRLEDYVEAAGSHYAKEMQQHLDEKRALLQIQGSFRTAFGSGRRREIVLWQKVVQPRGLVPLLTREVPAEYKQPGTWMHDALDVRDRWESKLLRTASWSPLY